MTTQINQAAGVFSREILERQVRSLMLPLPVYRSAVRDMAVFIDWVLFKTNTRNRTLVTNGNSSFWKGSRLFLWLTQFWLLLKSSSLSYLCFSCFALRCGAD